MVNINITIPEELHKKLRIKCAIEGITLKEFVINSLEKNSEDEDEAAK